MVTVSEEWVAIAILRCVEMEKAVVEGGGASGVAAVLAGLCPELKGKKYKFQNNFYLLVIRISSNQFLKKKFQGSNSTLWWKY